MNRSPYPSPRHGGHEGDSPSRRRQSAYDMPLIMPSCVSPDAAVLIVRLLARRPENRLGASFGDFKLLMVCVCHSVRLDGVHGYVVGSLCIG